MWVELTSIGIGLAYSYNLTSGGAPFPYTLVMNFRVFAQNGVGKGSYSTVLRVADSVPLFMNAPILNTLTDITPYWIYLTWTGISGYS